MSKRYIGLCAAFLSVLATAQVAAEQQLRGPDANGGVLTITGASLLATGYSELGEALSQFVPSFLVPQYSTFDGSDHVRTLVSDGLAPDHVVLLVNGHRWHASALLNRSDTVGRGSLGPDLTMIPLGMIQQVTVTRGVGAGRHGSGAVAAVIDVTLKDGAAKASLTGQYGLNSGELSGVRELLEVNLSGNQINPAYTGDRNVDDGDGDTLWLTGNWGFAIADDGFLQIGADYRDQDPTNRAGFDTRQLYPTGDNGALDVRELTSNRLTNAIGQSSTEQFNLMFNAAVPINDRLELVGQGSIGSLRSDTAAEFRRPLDARNIRERYPDGFLPIIRSDIDDRSLSVALRGQHRGWQWQLGTRIGENEIDWSLEDSLNASLGVISPRNFSVGNNESRENAFTLEASRVFSGSMPFELIVGIEHRAEEFEVERGGPASYINGGVLLDNGEAAAIGAQGFAGFKREELESDRDLNGAFAQFNAQFAGPWDLNAAVRYDDYSDIGGQFSGDLFGAYRHNEQWRFWGALAAGLRAPSLAQSYFAHTVTVIDAVGAATEAGVFGVAEPAARALGADALKEERFVSLRVGLEWQARPDVRLGFDLYRIDLSDRVLFSDVLAGDAVNTILAGAGVSDASSVQYFFNGADLRSQGANLSFDHHRETGYGRFGLSLAANWNEVRTQGLGSEPGVLSNLGVVRFGAAARQQLQAATPDNRLIATFDWRREKMNLLLRANRYGEVTDVDRAFTVDPVITLDALLSYQATPKAEVALGINNLLDEYPDVLPQGPDLPAFNQIRPFSNYAPTSTDGRFVYLRLNLAWE